ncbi:MAG: hypothetical protein K6B70_01565 [Clostridia bacterium]|nr:hypothetical protein [Clostridia bacterium]
MKEEEKIKLAQKKFEELGFSTENIGIYRIKEIKADYLLPKENQRGIGGIIIADDGTYLVCGSVYPLEHYVEDFKSGKRSN